MSKRNPTRRDAREPTPRDLDVAKLIALGLSNKQIAHAQHISESSVKFHVKQLLARWRLDNRTQIALKLHGLPIGLPEVELSQW